MEYHNWWNTQIDRCINGYRPSGGTKITGAHYFYLNFCKIHGYDKITNRKGMISPIYRDQDHEYFDEIQKAKEGGYGIIVLKARRKGFSFMNSNILLHDWTFFPHSENGIGAQKDDQVEDFRKKLMMTYMELPHELRNKTLHNNQDILMSGYKIQQDGQWLEKGTKSMIHFRTMDKPDAFRGTSLTYMVFEEAGMFRNLKASYNANEECFREGDVQFGVPIIGGTSDMMSNESRDYMELYYDAEKYNLKSLFIPANKVYYPFFDEKTGLSDTEGAKKAIEKRRAIKKQAKDKKAYYGFLQEMPLKPEDAFMNAGSTPFDVDKINEQKAQLLTNKNLEIVLRGKLEWGRDKNGKIEFGLNPDFIEDGEGPVRIVEYPTYELENSHVAAVDPYHADDLLDENIVIRESKGCMVIYRRFISPDAVGEMPVAIYLDRPEMKSEFYENCAKLAVYYDCQVLCEYNDDGFFHYFLNNGFQKYLKERPRSADSPYSTVSNRYGVVMKEHQKRMVTDLIDEYIKTNVEDIYFIEMLDEFLTYGTKNVDIAMAFGMCLMHDMDNKKSVKSKEIDEGEKMIIPHFKNMNGMVVPVNTNSSNFANNKKRPTFDYGY